MKDNKHKGNTLRSTVQTMGIEKFGRFYGVYYGIVKGNTDLNKQGRLLLYIPEIFGTSFNFRTAYPRGAVAGKDFGFHYRPKVGETVTVTFRFGDPKLPLWEPGYWGKDEMPEEFDSEDKIGFKSRNGSVVIFDDEEESITVYNKEGHTVKVEKDKITVGKDSQVIIEDNEVHIKNGSLDEPAVMGKQLKDILTQMINLLSIETFLVDTNTGKIITPDTATLTKLKLDLDQILANKGT